MNETAHGSACRSAALLVVAYFKEQEEDNINQPTAQVKLEAHYKRFVNIRADCSFMKDTLRGDDSQEELVRNWIESRGLYANRWKR